MIPLVSMDRMTAVRDTHRQRWHFIPVRGVCNLEPVIDHVDSTNFHTARLDHVTVAGQQESIGQPSGQFVI